MWGPLQEYTFLQVKGPDAEVFLQGQCTCDISALNTSTNFLLGAHCNHKGRMLSNFILIKIAADCFLLKLHASIAELAFSALKKYIVFSKAEITVVSSYLSLGLTGQQVPGEETLQESASKLQKSQYCLWGQSALLQHASNQWEIWLHKEDIASILPLMEKPLAFTQNDWDQLNISMGLAEVRVQTSGQFLPQEINFQLVDGISFSKGCYTGQEIIARIHYKASLKKHMYRVRTSADSLISPATEIFDGDSNKLLGTVLMSAFSPDGHIDLLALLPDSAIDQEKPVLLDNSVRNLQCLPLPYAIPK